MSLFKTIFERKKKETALQSRFTYPLFIQGEIQDEIAKKGYSVQPLLTAEDIVQLIQDFSNLLELMQEPLPDIHWSSGRVTDVSIRNFARHSINKIIPHKLEKYFDKSSVDFIGGIYVAKKPSPSSRLYPHQDSSHTDEKKFPAVYAWIALTNTSIANGAMHILPGSHLWGNRFRSLNIPWLYDGLQENMFPFLQPVPMKAGEVLFFDSAAIHYSSDNMSDEIRPAINFFVKPKEALFLHHFMDEKTPKEKVEVYNVDIDFFYNCDFMKRPAAPYTFIGYEEYNLKIPTKQELETLCTKYAPE